eukprot:CAMPEP_0172569114 /NCGR_PEP_ID=MMETSP1067-20121228/122300_1 /TAXON_ID=265564 ORGANISM="Thalassiosira punctigera, Strain Tpunct2005C2" /NCGR_SAMPLE_ID=MMETSP1067 /ASSEMBLY_ACC=CAM_ASM_000444 /LENGTH=38 /DNA_ID= /DNA_START= /DNA_END= /DNA_ORIENTATION=
MLKSLGAAAAAHDQQRQAAASAVATVRGQAKGSKKCDG